MLRIVWMRSAALVAAAILITLLGPSSTVSAHEHREVGSYEFVVGWSDEPAFAGEKNGLDLRVMQRETEEPVEGLEKTLNVEIIFGDQKRQLEIRPVFRQPGHYTSDIVPTKEGDYRFHVFGAIGDLQVDETFDSADGQFSGVESIGAMQFPEALPSVSEAVQAANAVEQRAAAAESAVTTAQTLGIASLVMAILGMLLGAVALVRSGRQMQAAKKPAGRGPIGEERQS